MEEIINKLSYIVCYREQNNERKQALEFTLSKLRKYFPGLEIILVEQDSVQKATLDESLQIRHFFLYNPNLFNRSWAFNYAVKQSDKDIFIFADVDIFLELKGYEELLKAAESFEAVKPNNVSISIVSIDSFDNGTFTYLNERKLYSFAGGLLLMTRKGYEKIGGWDERFEGWGGEDNALTHVIFNRLRSKSLALPNYHIDHPLSIGKGNEHPSYAANRALAEEIISRNGISIDRYIKQLKDADLGNPNRYKSKSTNDIGPLRFVFAVTSFNRLDYLKSCISSFLETRSDLYEWQIIIADDGSDDGSEAYLKEVENKHGAILIRNQRRHIHHQVNTIIKQLSEMTFDICFKCDDDIVFRQAGWDTLYWQTTQRTGYEHLVFYDKNWQVHRNLPDPIECGGLVSHCNPEDIQGAFYTLTSEIIEHIGYLDTQLFGSSGLGHVDYSFRCCRAGFNVLTSPFDVEDSNNFIQLQSIVDYQSAKSDSRSKSRNLKLEIKRKKELLYMARVYIPYNDNMASTFDSKTILKQASNLLRKSNSPQFKMADATFYSDRGFIGLIGFLIKRLYNFSIKTRLYFIPSAIKKIGRFLHKTSTHLINIDKK